MHPSLSYKQFSDYYLSCNTILLLGYKKQWRLHPLRSPQKKCKQLQDRKCGALMKLCYWGAREKSLSYQLEGGGCYKTGRVETIPCLQTGQESPEEGRRARANLVFNIQWETNPVPNHVFHIVVPEPPRMSDLECPEVVLGIF